MNDHEMIYDGSIAYGQEYWKCPICGRVLSFSLIGPLRVTVIVEGDNTASHSGSRGLTIGAVTAQEEGEGDLSAFEPFIEELDMRGLD